MEPGRRSGQTGRQRLGRRILQAGRGGDAGRRDGGGAIIAVLLLLVVVVLLFLYFGGYLGRAAEETDININVDTPALEVPEVRVPDIDVNLPPAEQPAEQPVEPPANTS